jgi:hypothetical protein
LNINFVYSAWWLLPGILAAGGLSYFLYARDRQLRDLPRKSILALAVLRFLFISGIIFLLLGPTLNIQKTEKEEPVFILAQDNSSSVLLNADSLYYTQEYPEALNALKSELSKDFDLHYMQFGDSVNDVELPDFSDGISNFSDLHFAVEAGYSGRHVAGMLLATDGLYNEDRKPLYLFSDLKFPVFTLALGDTLRKRDALISDARYNRLAFLNNRFPLRVYYEANKLDGERMQIKLLKGDATLASRNIPVDGNDISNYIDFKVKASETGLQTYRVRIEPMEDEISLENNEQLISVNIIDNQQEILIMAAAPHPDIAAINRALKQNKNFSVETKTLSDLPVSLEKTDLIVFHEVPERQNAASSIFEQAEKRNIPALFILGPRSNVQAFNSLALPLAVNIKGRSYDDAQPAEIMDFDRFRLSPDFLDILENMPPLKVHFADYRFSGTHDVLFSQRINSVETGKPLIALSGNEKRKMAFITGTGIWRWRITDYIQNGNQKGFDDLINNLMQYLITKSSGKQFAVSTEQIISENRSLVFEAELYNEAYELINDPEVELTLTDSTGESSSYTFRRSLNAYRLGLGSMSAGQYEWKAEVNYNNHLYTEEGSILIEPVSLEGLKTSADHKMLNQISKASGGEMFTLEDMQNIPLKLESYNLSKPRISTSMSQSVLLNLKWIFFLLLGLISIEWFFRKFWGGY